MTQVAAKPPASYRPDIDGLRAVAVLGVFVFHLASSALPGGFVGVDVFFVLSGYLITAQVTRQIAAGQFRFRHFYLRRLRRLFPALALVVATCWIGAYLWLLPTSLYSFAQSVLAQPLAWQNFHFLADGNYFQGADTKPLLHTWSLGVEEQFYLGWPLVLVLFSRLGPGAMRAAILVLGIVSFGVCQWLPSISGRGAFYLLPARAWELALGAWLSWPPPATERHSGPAPAGAARQMVAGCALLALLCSFWAIDSKSRFPGTIALWPVLATAALLPQGPSRAPTVIHRVLAHPALSALGRISYSLYLWHWPWIVFAQAAGFELKSAGTALGIVTLSVACAALSTHWLEQPIRRRRALGSDRQLLLAWLASSALLCGVASLALSTEGLSFRYEQPARSMLTASFRSDTRRCGFVFRTLHPRASRCPLHDAEPPGEPGGVLLWGNSHADMWSEQFRRLGEQFEVPVYLNARNCRPVLDNSFCRREQSILLRFIQEQSIEAVVLASTWHGSKGRTDAELEEELFAVLEQLDALSVPVWFVLDVPQSPQFDPERRYRATVARPSFGALPFAEFEEQGHRRQVILTERLRQRFPSVNPVDPAEVLCVGQARQCLGGQNGQAWYRDAHHVTHAGAAMARPLFEPIFAKLLSSRSTTGRQGSGDLQQ